MEGAGNDGKNQEQAPLSIEEAGEILLEGKATGPCGRCEGKGVVLNTTMPLNERKPASVFCPACKGSRLVFDLRWYLAWKVINPDDSSVTLDSLKSAHDAAVKKLWEGRIMEPKLW